MSTWDLEKIYPSTPTISTSLRFTLVFSWQPDWVFRSSLSVIKFWDQEDFKLDPWNIGLVTSFVLYIYDCWYVQLVLKNMQDVVWKPFLQCRPDLMSACENVNFGKLYRLNIHKRIFVLIFWEPTFLEYPSNWNVSISTPKSV